MALNTTPHPGTAALTLNVVSNWKGHRRRIAGVIRHPENRTSEDKLEGLTVQKERLRRKTRSLQVCEKQPEQRGNVLSFMST